MTRKSRSFLAILATIFLAARLVAAEPEVLDGIAAIVNGDIITYSQVRDLVGAREKALREQYQGQQLIDKVKETRMGALQDLIDRQLIIQEFKKKEFKIPSYVIEEHVNTIIREEFSGNRDAFLRTLQAQGLTLDKFKKDELEKIIVQAMRQNNVKSDLVVGPSKISSYYDQNKKDFSTKAEVKLRMIVINKAGTPVSRKAMAEEIRGKLTGGADFAKLAQVYSNDSTQLNGGDWGWIDQATLDPKLSEAAFSLSPGKISRVIDFGDNYYILTVEARRGGTFTPMATVRGDIEKKLSQTENQKMQKRWLESLREKAYIKTF